MPFIVNLFSGPCGGKSTQAAGLFYKLKVLGYNCELITEKAKDLVWEENDVALSSQVYVTGSQLHRQERVESKVDIVITDSPFILGIHYWPSRGSEIDSAYQALLVGIFKTKQNYNVFLNRPETYNPVGRQQNHKEAIEVDNSIKYILSSNGIEYDEHYSTPAGLDVLVKSVLFEYNK